MTQRFGGFYSKLPLGDHSTLQRLFEELPFYSEDYIVDNLSDSNLVFQIDYVLGVYKDLLEGRGAYRLDPLEKGELRRDMAVMSRIRSKLAR